MRTSTSRGRHVYFWQRGCVITATRKLKSNSVKINTVQQKLFWSSKTIQWSSAKIPEQELLSMPNTDAFVLAHKSFSFLVQKVLLPKHAYRYSTHSTTLFHWPTFVKGKKQNCMNAVNLTVWTGTQIISVKKTSIGIFLHILVRSVQLFATEYAAVNLWWEQLEKKYNPGRI